MSNVLKRPASTNAEYKAEAERLSHEMDLLFEKMDSSRAESERIKVETKVISDRIDKRLDELEKFVQSLSSAA